MKIKSFDNVKSLFLDNKTLKQTIFKNTFWLAIGEGISRVLILILTIFIARVLGVTNYGKFTFALSFVSLFVAFYNFGLPYIVTRELSQRKEAQEKFPAILSLQIILGIIAFILMFSSSFFITSDPLIRKVIWILALYIIIDNFFEILFAAIRAYQKMEYEALGKILKAILITSIGFFIILNSPTIKNLSYSFLFSILIALIFTLLIFHFLIQHLGLKWEKTIWREFLISSYPLALTAICFSVYNYAGSVMMGHLGQITEAGWYNAAYKLIYTTIIPMTLISQSFFPVLSRFFKESKEKLQEVWNYYMELMIVLAIPLITGGIILAPRIINSVYNSSFNPAVFVFQILIVMAGVTFLCDPLEKVLIVVNHQKKIFYIAFSGAVTNVILNFILIPRYTLYGAAISTLITYFLLFVLLLIFTRYFTPIFPFNVKLTLVLIAVILATLGMSFIITKPILFNLNIAALIIIGILIYSALIFFLLKFIFFFKKCFQKEK
jgi:O-antigen/teichoic acid export membrane protein